MRAKTISSMMVVLDMDQEDASDLFTELERVIDVEKDQLAFPVIREVMAQLENALEEEEEEEEEEQDQDECGCESVKHNALDIYCHACGGRIPESEGVLRKKAKKKARRSA